MGIQRLTVDEGWLVGELQWHRASGKTQLATFQQQDVRRDTVDR